MLDKHTVSLTNGSVNGKQDRLVVAAIAGIVTPASASAVTGTSITAAGTGFKNPANVVFTPSAGSAKLACTALKAVSATVVVGGTSGYAVNDTVTLSNGVILTVASVSSGVIVTVTIQTAGSFTGAVATNPVAQTATSGSGVGTPTFNVNYGLLTVVIVNSGNGSNPTWTVTDSTGAGSGATLTSSQGGNSNPIFIQVADSNIPAVCVATYDTNFSCNGYVSRKTAGSVTYALVPIGATTLAAGTMDALIFA